MPFGSTHLDEMDSSCIRFLFGHTSEAAAIGLGRVRIDRRELGSIDLPDGRVYACDPLVPMDATPLAERLVPGDYKVVLFVAVAVAPATSPATTECNAAAALICGEEIPERWELARRDGGPEDAAAYGVDSGTGGFMGSGAIELLVEADERSKSSIMENLKHVSGAVVSVRNGSRVAAFASGIGDGVYDTWLGRGAQGNPAVILTDFGTLETPEYVEAVHAEWDRRRATKWWQFWK